MKIKYLALKVSLTINVIFFLLFIYILLIIYPYEAVLVTESIVVEPNILDGKPIIYSDNSVQFSTLYGKTLRDISTNYLKLQIDSWNSIKDLFNKNHNGEIVTKCVKGNSIHTYILIFKVRKDMGSCLDS